MGYFFRFWTQVICTALYIINQRKKETQRAESLLHAIEEAYAGKFVPATRKKVAVSYGIYTPMICDAFTALHGRPTNDAEKERFIHYFICSSLFDDFTDITTLPENELLSLSFEPESFHPRNFDEAVFRDSHLLLKAFVHERTVYEALTRRLFQAQWDSKKQAIRGKKREAELAVPVGEPNRIGGSNGMGEALSDEELREITFRKGGLSVLLCSFYLDLSPSPAERDCWYRIGTIIQLTNDLYDIYKDLNDHMDTLPVRIRDVHAFRAFFEEQVQGMQQAIQKLEVPEKRKETFKLAMAGIYSFGFIALDQLQALQGDAPTLPQLNTLTRKQLVIDMEKKKNLVRWCRYTYAQAKI